MIITHDEYMPHAQIQMTVQGIVKPSRAYYLGWQTAIALLQLDMSKKQEPRFNGPFLGGREQLFSLRARESRRSELDISIIFSSYSPGEKVDKTHKNLLPTLAAVHNQLEFAFTTPDQEPSQPWNVVRKAISFAKLKEELLHENQEMFVAKPLSNRCLICRCSFEDYNLHINSPAHLTAQNQNHATGYIKGLCGKFNQQRRNSCLEEYSPEAERPDKSERMQEEITEDLNRRNEQ